MKWLLPAVLLVLIGCTGGVSDGTNVETVKDDGVFKVALLTPGAISDMGWNAMAYDGLMAIKDELGCEVDNREAKDAQIKDAMRSYAQKDYDLVLGHGFEYNAPGVEMAKVFPSTVFVSASGDLTAENAGAFRFYLEQGFYLCGYMAATMSKTGKIAAVGFNSIPSIKSTFRAYVAGAQAADPDIIVIEPEMGMDADIAKFKQATLAAIVEGADFVIHQANDGAQGVFDACKEKGVYAFGANSNQNGPGVIASAVISARPAYVALAEQVEAGTYKGSVTLMGMADGAIGFAINNDLVSKVPKDLLEKLTEMQSKITSGELVVPKDDF